MNASSAAIIAPKAVPAALEELFARFHRREFVHPDPLEFLYGYADPRDREIVALLAASLAYGRVAQILRNVEWLLKRIGPPAQFVRRSSAAEMRGAVAGFRHRWTSDAEVAALLQSIKRIIEAHGSLRDCFMKELHRRDETVLPALDVFAGELTSAAGNGCPSLVSAPRDGSACKRMNLFLRWLVRHDEVDPGGWEAVGAQRLVVPLDVHIFRLCRRLGLTAKRQANLRTALEITAAFRALAPADPTRYDFSLSRLGIRKDADPEAFFGRWRLSCASAAPENARPAHEWDDARPRASSRGEHHE